MKNNIMEQILKEKLRDRPNLKLIQKLQQLLDEEQKTKSSRRTRD